MASSALFRKSDASAPLSVTTAPMVWPCFIPKAGNLFLALVYAASRPVSFFMSCFALSSFSSVAPMPMFRTTFSR